MITGFQKYLVDKGFKRTKTEWVGKQPFYVEDYQSNYISTYGPLHYNFHKGDKYCYWGLAERNKPPVMCLGSDKMIINGGRTYEDGYRILFSKFGEDKYDDIYDVFISKDKIFFINCSDEKDIKISVLCQTNYALDSELTQKAG